MKLAQVSHRHALVDDIGLSAGVQVGVVAVWIVVGLFVHAHAVKKFLHNALHGEEIAFPVHAQGKLHALVGQLG